jgi:hypothetical protein
MSSWACGACSRPLPARHFDRPLDHPPAKLLAPLVGHPAIVVSRAI